MIAIIGTSDQPCWLAEACKILLLLNTMVTVCKAWANCHACLQAFFAFFNSLNSYWVAPMVNLVFILVAILTQLFLTTLWGKAFLAWFTPKQPLVSVDTNPKPSSEQQRLLAAAQHWRISHSSSATEEQFATGLGSVNESSDTMYVELSDAHYLLHHHDREPVMQLNDKT